MKDRYFNDCTIVESAASVLTSFQLYKVPEYLSIVKLESSPHHFITIFRSRGSFLDSLVSLSLFLSPPA